MAEYCQQSLIRRTVRTSADSSTYVVTEERNVAVSVRGSGQGIVIIDGIHVGTRVHVTGGGERDGEE